MISLTKRKYKADFLEYYQATSRKAPPEMDNPLTTHFFDNFVHGKCTFEEIDVELCNKFREIAECQTAKTGWIYYTETLRPATGPHSE